MIFHTGHQVPTVKQRRRLFEVADASFLVPIPENFGELPCGPNFRREESTGISIKMRCVEPHRDNWVGCGKTPRSYAAVFWLVDMPGARRGNFGFYSDSLILQVGDEDHRMRPGDFVIFKDTVLHSVYSNLQWIGCAYQAKRFFEKRKG